MSTLPYGEATVRITLDSDPVWVSSTEPGADTLANLLTFAGKTKSARTFVAEDVPLAPLLGWSRQLLPLSSTVTTDEDVKKLNDLRIALSAAGWDSAAVYAGPLDPLGSEPPDIIVTRAATKDQLVDLVVTTDTETILIVECPANGPRDAEMVSILGTAFREVFGATPETRPGVHWFICSP